jgi:hypothetical protein
MRRARMARLIALTALGLALAGSAALPASASTGDARASAAAGSATASLVTATQANGARPAGTYNNLYFCDYTIASDNIAVWKWPGGASRSGGNTADVRLLKGVAFNSIPWISTGTVDGQRWIYGVALIPSSESGGSLEYVYGWVGIDYLDHALPCGYDYFSTSNQVTTGTHYGDPFTSSPAETSASYQGQTWVFGEDPFANGNTGWIGRKYLTLSSCTSSGCYYDINASNIREWILPGGADGP